MPKRPATPPIDDGAKYLTVVRPFPHRPNMEFEAHRRLFAQWVAACIGPDYIRAFYHKPTSPGSIICEIDDALRDFDRILGAHKWSAFLEAPGEEGHYETNVFYCTYNSDRTVQKHGWKRVDVTEGWIAKRSPKFVSPYPKTTWCDIPKIGNVIQNDLCRPLPRARFPPPPTEPAPVVGTPEWQEWNRRQEGSRTVRGWVRGTPPESLHAPPRSATMSPSSASRAPSRQATPTVQPVPRQAWRAATPLSPPGLPSGILRPTSSASSHDSSTSERPNARSRTPSVGSNFPQSASLSSGSSSSSSSSDPSPSSLLSKAPHDGAFVVAGDHVEAALSALTLSDAEDDLYYSVVDTASISGNPKSFPLLDSPQVEHTVTGTAEMSLWDVSGPADSDSDVEDADEKWLAKEAAKNPELCRVHNKVCKHGICKVYAEQERARKNQKRIEERNMERNAALEAREKRNRKRDESEEDGDTGYTRLTPAHLRSRAPVPSGPVRELPPHLRRNASAPSTVNSKASDSDSATGRVTPTPTRRPEVDDGSDEDEEEDEDDAQSQSSSRWDTVTDDPWAPTKPAKGKGNKAKTSASASASNPAPKALGAWGKSGSVNASSMQRNEDSWSASGRSTGRGGNNVASAPQSDDDDGGADGSGEGKERAYDELSVSGRSSTGWGTVSDGPWGSSDKVRGAAASARAGKGNGSKKKTWADEVEEASNAGSTASWGNVSAGPW
ncbi:hypothetical protein C8Q74DRAFT_1214239 [Fomes fomentarius]|nr:hypothetical protein C8Q74DRAFT_1214239 [Fomes fomentarius]